MSPAIEGSTSRPVRQKRKPKQLDDELPNPKPAKQPKRQVRAKPAKSKTGKPNPVHTTSDPRAAGQPEVQQDPPVKIKLEPGLLMDSSVKPCSMADVQLPNPPVPCRNIEDEIAAHQISAGADMSDPFTAHSDLDEWLDLTVPKLIDLTASSPDWMAERRTTWRTLSQNPTHKKVSVDTLNTSDVALSTLFADTPSTDNSFATTIMGVAAESESATPLTSSVSKTRPTSRGSHVSVDSLDEDTKSAWLNAWEA